MQKADLQPGPGADPNHVAIGETVIRINDDQFWLFVAVNPATNHLLRVQLFQTRTTATTRMFFEELRTKHQIDDATFLVNRTPGLLATLH